MISACMQNPNSNQLNQLDRSSRLKKSTQGVAANNSGTGETSLRPTTKDKQRGGRRGKGENVLLVRHGSRADRSHAHKLVFSWQPGRTFKTDRRCFYCFSRVPRGSGLCGEIGKKEKGALRALLRRAIGGEAGLSVII